MHGQPRVGSPRPQERERVPRMMLIITRAPTIDTRRIGMVLMLAARCKTRRCSKRASLHSSMRECMQAGMRLLIVYIIIIMCSLVLLVLSQAWQSAGKPASTHVSLCKQVCKLSGPETDIYIYIYMHTYVM